MKKLSLSDQLELKIRQMNDKYRNTKRLARENVAQGGKFSSQENIRDLIRKDLKSYLPKIKVRISRDVSHIKDLKTPKGSASVGTLPTDINQVRKLLDQQSIATRNSMHLCHKSTCVDRVSMSYIDLEDTAIGFLENLDHGIPSGRIEAENLNVWFEKMKLKYENHQEFDAIILFCGQELLKQVYVECKSRGNLLKSILGYYHMLLHNKTIKYTDVVNTITSEFEKKIEKLKKSHSDGINKCNNKIGELTNLIEKYLNIIDQGQEEVSFYKKKYQDMQRAYLEEQEIWRKQSLNYMRDSNRRGMVLNNEPHSLAIARWRKGLFETGSKTVENEEINSLIPVGILEKIEKGEPLDPKELEEYQEIYMKSIKQQYEHSHQTTETQTDPETIPSETAGNQLLIETSDPSENPSKLWGAQSIPNPTPNSIPILMFSKEVQTTFIDGLNESELLEIQSILELQGEFEGESEEDSEPDLSPRHSSNNKSPSSSNSSRSYNMQYDYMEAQDTPHRTPVYGEALGIVTETKSESEFPSENEERDVVISEFHLGGRGHRKTHAEDSNKRGNTERKGRNFTEKWDEGHDVGSSDSEGDLYRSGKGNQTRRKPEKNSEESKRHIMINESEVQKFFIDENRDESKRHIMINESEAQKFFIDENRDQSVLDQDSIGIYRDPSESVENNSKNFSFSQSDHGHFKQTSTSIFSKREESKKINYSVVEIREDAKGIENDKYISNSESQKIGSSNKSTDKISKRGLIKDDEGRFSKKNLSNKFTTSSLSKLDSALTEYSGEFNKTGSLAQNFSRKSLMLKEIMQGKLGSIKQTAASLAKIIKNRKKELADLEDLIENKKKLLENQLNSSVDSQNDQLNRSLSKSLNRKSPFHTSNLTTTALIQKISKIIDPKTPSQSDSPLQLSEENRGLIENLLVALKKDQMKPARHRNTSLTSSSLTNTPINECKDFEEQVSFPEDYDQNAWKNGYSVGYSRGKTNGFSSGKTLGREEGVIEGYMQAVKEINDDDSLLADSEKENSRVISNAEQNSGLQIPKPKRSRKPSVANEIIKSTKELTKFAEFRFARQKALLIKATSPALGLTKKLVAKSMESILKKATISRKMINKMIAMNYQIAISKISSEVADELLIISYEEISQKYGLKKVTDRKFLEFIASVMKNKQHKKCYMFMRLAGLGSLKNLEIYSKFTLSLYLESLQYMLNSKIGITMNYEESEDINMFPINRAVECAKEKLEGRVDRQGILAVISNLERKAVPDPQRISTALIDLEFTLELVCDAYETAQKSIKKGVEMVLFALGYSETQSILQYDFSIIVRAMIPSKYQRFEDEDTVSQEITHEEAVELSVDLHALSENDVNAFVKNYQKKPFDNYSELDMIIEKMRRSQGDWISVSEDEWKKRIDQVAKKWDESNVYAIIAWRVYEQELIRINTEYL